jgi:hypothetical protein
VKLDDYFKNLDKKIDFVKIDIEGSEYNAVFGMQGLLKENQKLKLISEFWPIGIKRSGADPKAYLDLLANNNFKLSELNEQENEFTLEKENYTNILCEKIN